jgi:hypothetical protein
MKSEKPGGQAPGLSDNKQDAASTVERRADGNSRLRDAKRAALLQWVKEQYEFVELFGAPKLSDVYARDGFGQFTGRREADIAVAELVDAGHVQLWARKGEVVLVPVEGQR